LKSYEGLEKVPIEIKEQGTKAIIQYILDLFGDSKSLYRSKLMIVGYENVGKTTLVDCFFPFTGYMKSQGAFVKTLYWFKLEGLNLMKFRSPNDKQFHRMYYLEPKKWEVNTIGDVGICLTPKERNERKVELYCEDQQSRDKWFKRFQKVLVNSATHGIQIDKQFIDNPSNPAFSYLEDNNDEKLEISVWDFAGQHDYYHSHHYFLSTRTLFLVVYNLSQDEEGLNGLNFWLRSLSARLPLSSPQNGKDFSVIIVGTSYDHPNVLKDEKSKLLRQEKVSQIASNYGINSVDYFEVSCLTLENINLLRQKAFSTIQSHSYIGEKVPLTYLAIENVIEELKEEYKTVPIIELETLIQRCRSTSTFDFKGDFIKRVLRLLNEWGKCTYFDKPEELSNILVLRSEFLTKDVLAQLFNPNLHRYRNQGILVHQDLKQIWKDFVLISPILISLMEKFEVSFPLEEDEEGNNEINQQQESVKEKGFWEKKSVIPSLLPEEVHPSLTQHWPPIIFDRLQVERIILFNIIPKEMIGRLLTRLYQSIYHNLVWRHGVVIFKKNSLALIQVDLQKNLITLKVRGENILKCRELMDRVIEYIEIATENYENVQWNQMVVSSYDQDTFISLEDCRQEVTKVREERNLVCPKTKKQLDVELLLFSTGIEILSAESESN